MSARGELSAVTCNGQAQNTRPAIEFCESNNRGSPEAAMATVPVSPHITSTGSCRRSHSLEGSIRSTQTPSQVNIPTRAAPSGQEQLLQVTYDLESGLPSASSTGFDSEICLDDLLDIEPDDIEAQRLGYLVKDDSHSLRHTQTDIICLYLFCH